MRFLLSISLLFCTNLWAHPEGMAPEREKGDDDTIIEEGDETLFDDDEDEAIFEDDEENEEQALKQKRKRDFGMTIFGAARKKSRISGNASAITEKELERFEKNNIEKVIDSETGVYARTEDGNGLRPNIGLRGASSDRSAKVTLMEDGVLFGPAPYAAPAAYYFPLVTRMRRVEIFKGPGAVRFGPTTVGGALNLLTRSVPNDFEAKLDFSAGSFSTLKGHGSVGTKTDVGPFLLGVLLEGARVQSDGFKTLKSGDPTGFTRNDAMFKLRLSTQEDAETFHAIEFKVGYGDERSNETYLGVTDADFAANPFERYAASQLGLMEWARTQGQVRYILSSDWGLDLSATVYRHDFDRSWRKFNRFLGGPDASLLLKNPEAGTNAIFTEILRGNRDSESIDETLQIGTNRRFYFSQGIQVNAAYGLELGPTEHFLEAGVRLHQDQIQRVHTEDSHLMRNGVLVPDGSERQSLVENRGLANALALHLSDEIEWGNLVVVPGMRVEFIQTEFEDFKTNEIRENTQLAFMPGLGASYTFNKSFGLLAGVHRGFSPVSPGQSADVLPEDSVNVELGGRGGFFMTDVEAVAFGNRYTNLTGECTFSTGCSDVILGQQFNGGEVWVYGLEARVRQGLPLPFDAEAMIDFTYTFTGSQFQTGFRSDNPQFGDVEVGDELAYVPRHRGALNFLYAQGAYEFASTFTFASAMRDEAGQGAFVGSDGYALINLATNYNIFENTRLYMTVDNLLNTRVVASRRPFGARPMRPATFNVGLKHTFQ